MAKTKYDPETFPNLARHYASEGLNEAQIAKNLGVSKGTFEDYKKKYPDFLTALKEGKAPVISDIEHALYTRAKGFTGPDGKYYPPDSTACIFALKNMNKEKWRDKQSHEISGPDGGPVNVKVIAGASIDDL